MLTLKKIREDLKDIQYYYANQKMFDAAAKTVGQCSVVEKVERYNQAVKHAPVRLYNVYVSLYVHNNTQEAVADDWDCTSNNVRLLNKQLRDFLYSALNNTLKLAQN